MAGVRLRRLDGVDIALFGDWLGQALAPEVGERGPADAGRAG
ncbi:hypothetical protein [Thermobifida halotolerans]|nr:hypothetical protein [Thermobifida halotolerans]